VGTGGGTPDITNLTEIAKIFNVSIDFLVTGNEEKPIYITISKLELAAKEDDINCLGSVNISSSDENGHDLWFYILKYESTKLFTALIEKGKARELLSAEHTRGNDRISDLLYMLIISNRLNELKSFGFRDINYSNKEEWSEKALTALVSDKRVNDETRDLVLLTNREKIHFDRVDGETVYFDGVCNAKEMFPEYLKVAVKFKNIQFAERIINTIEKINATYNKLANSRRHFDSSIYFFINIKKDTLELMLSQNLFDLLDKALECNRLVKGDSIPPKSIELQKMIASGTVTTEELMLYECTNDHILDVELLLSKTNDLGKIKQYLYEMPLIAYDVGKQFVAKNDFSGLLKYIVDHNLKVNRDCFSEPDVKKMCGKVLLELAKDATVLESEKNVSIMRKYLDKSGFSWHKPVGSIEDVESDLNRFRYCLMSELSLQDDKRKTVGAMTKDYFESLLMNGNFRHASQDICTKLEKILLVDYRYEGSLEEMVTKYFDEHKIDDGWGYYIRNTNMESAVHKIRKYRNDTSHGSPITDIPTNEELKQVIRFVFDIERNK